MFLSWIDESKLNNLPWVKGRNNFGAECNKLNPDEIIKKYVYISNQDVTTLMKWISRMHGNVFHGVGIELGAGVALFSSVLTRHYKKIDKIYAVELVPFIAKKIQKKIIKKYGDVKKVISVLGSFDDLRLKDNTCDFIIEYDSLHHSFNLKNTLKEAYRVLKPGGVLIAIDRVQPNTMHSGVKYRLLNKVYDKNFLNLHHYDQDSILTREKNGEHEYREKEWKLAFSEAGFKNFTLTHFTKTSFKYFFFSFLVLLPEFVISKTRYKYLSAYPIYKSFTSYLRREPSKENIGKFIGCLSNLKTLPATTKSIIFVQK
jgi:ubiquinone/menaquinone biosynthesis C-methylase UbiE